MDSPSEEAPSPTPRKLSCSVCFDAVWFCYSPVHQMQQYYRLGTLDNCANKWSALYDCLSLKTKRSSEVQEILEAREKAKLHIWTFRTPEEASAHWNRLFGHFEKNNSMRHEKFFHREQEYTVGTFQVNSGTLEVVSSSGVEFNFKISLTTNGQEIRPMSVVLVRSTNTSPNSS